LYRALQQQDLSPAQFEKEWKMIQTSSCKVAAIITGMEAMMVRMTTMTAATATVVAGLFPPMRAMIRLVTNHS
jgi:hypothetical protein